MHVAQVLDFVGNQPTQTHFVCFFFPGEVQTLRPTAPEECAL